jgi:hypothetical protein
LFLGTSHCLPTELVNFIFLVLLAPPIPTNHGADFLTQSLSDQNITQHRWEWLELPLSPKFHSQLLTIASPSSLGFEPDEDITTSDTTTPSIEVQGPITRS